MQGSYTYYTKSSNIQHHTATHCNTPQHTATHRNTPQHTATHCNTHTATHCKSLIHSTPSHPIYSAAQTHKRWRRPIECLILLGRSPRKSPIISGQFAQSDVEIKASYRSLPPCRKLDATGRFPQITLICGC